MARLQEPESAEAKRVQRPNRRGCCRSQSARLQSRDGYWEVVVEGGKDL